MVRLKTDATDGELGLRSSRLAGKNKKVLKTESSSSMCFIDFQVGSVQRVSVGGASLHHWVLPLAAQASRADSTFRWCSCLCKLCGVIKGDASSGWGSLGRLILP